MQSMQISANREAKDEAVVQRLARRPLIVVRARVEELSSELYDRRDDLGPQNGRQENYRRSREEERIRLEQRFMSRADCGWLQINKSQDFYCRRNGRIYRTGSGKDKRWKLYRIAALDDPGHLLGTYQSRRDANKALEKIAYEAEPSW